MTIYYTKYGGIIHNPEAFYKLGGDIYTDKRGAFKVKKDKKRQFNPKLKNKSFNYKKIQEYKKEMNLGYSYYITRIKEYQYSTTYFVLE